ncbi:GntR family transcriptional regulator [Macrococcoides canis]|uniref:GntR family transcriptional regulator n=1 Tax=Macrococcoides canis TaxID=1855823 RepID=UPI001B8D7761|nr:GntR family transcriptional regulator [Macrococcus canis]QUR94082.1 GntR family transcriptional regulator [Macrococcus canis]UTH02968.1 GntR family transcriptional regulator [Macrococcus canis]
MIPKQWLEQLSTGEQIAFDLRYKIIANHLKDGEKLSENTLAQMYEVSRSPIRDALKLLAHDKLIRLERMGAVITALSESDIRELYDMRLMIESFAFERLKSDDIEQVVLELQKKLEMMKVAVKFDDAAEFTLQDILFHQTMIESIKHRQLKKLWMSIKPTMLILNLISMQQRLMHNKMDFERIFNNHEEYIEAVEHRNRKQYKHVLHINFDDVHEEIDDLFYSQTKEEL